MRRTPRWRHIGVSLALVLAAASGTERAVEAVDVEVDATSFRPMEVHVAVGGTVVWNVREDGHTIVADDGRFAFPGPGGGAVPAGSTVSHEFSGTDEVVRYHCTLHGGPGGQGMSGIIVVGSPTVERPARPVLRVPQDVGSLSDAVAAARPGDRIELAPGAHRIAGPLELDLRDVGEPPRGLEIVGTGQSPAEVVVDLAVHPQIGPPASVLHVTGAFISLRNLTVDPSLVSAAGSAVLVEGADQVVLSDVVIASGGLARDGVRAVGSNGLTLERTTVQGARRAGIVVSDCVGCGARLLDVTATGNLVGVLVEGAVGVEVRGGTFHDNAAGIVARSSSTRASALTISGARVLDNVSRAESPDVASPDRRLATGAGIWLDGSVDSVVAGNVVSGNQFGIVLTGGALRDRIVDNTAIGNATDLGWNGVGLGTCFGGNRHGSSSPPRLEQVSGCGGGGLVVPYPAIDAQLLAAAYS